MKNLPPLLASFMAVSLAVSATADNWPAWRGPTGTGVSGEENLPVRFGKDEKVRWRVELPGPGNSSPIVWGDRVFVSQAVDEDNRRTLMCFDRGDGELLWQAGVTYTGEEPTHDSNPYCAGTPATDGERVYVCFGSPGVYAYDFQGNEVWHRNLGELNHVFGTAVSPILYNDVCIVNFGPGEGTRLVALNKHTGETVWEVEPPAVDPSELAPPGGRFGGPGGPDRGRRGGPSGGRFGPGMMLAPQMFSQADQDEDGKLTKAEFTALADSWFDTLDADDAGTLDEEQFVERLNSVLPPPEGVGPPGGRSRGGRGRGGFGPARFLGPGLFSAVDSNEDESLTREELRGTFEKWASEWDSEKSGSLSEDQLRDGLTAALPRPNFGGRGRGGPGGFGGSWGVPILVTTGGRDELVMGFPGRLVAYDPATGKQLWASKGLGGTIYTTPVWGEGLVIATSSDMSGGSAIAVRPGDSGDVTESQRLWRLDRFEAAIGSGVIHDGHLYSISREGITTCIDLKTGENVWQRRLRGAGSRGGSWSSMLLVDGKIYVPNQSGDVFVLRASPQFELLATNSVGESTNASLAASDGDLFMRTDEALWCFSSN